MPIDYKKYPPDWSKTRQRILDRAGNCCEFCGIENGACAVKTDKSGLYVVVLTIAHLDHDVENWAVKDKRLAALCQLCHLRYDAEEKARRRWINRYENSLFPIK